MKKWIYICLALFLCMVNISGTMAFFSDSDETINVFTPGKNDTEIEEIFPGPTPVPVEDDPHLEKTVWVTNSSHAENRSSVDCYVRVRIFYSNYDIGKAVTLDNLDTANWDFDSRDGYYYYTKVLSEGESTTPLFRGVSIRSELIEDSMKKNIPDFCIRVYEESIQADGFPDYHSAWKYYENPVDTV